MGLTDLLTPSGFSVLSLGVGLASFTVALIHIRRAFRAHHRDEALPLTWVSTVSLLLAQTIAFLLLSGSIEMSQRRLAPTPGHLFLAGIFALLLMYGGLLWSVDQLAQRFFKIEPVPIHDRHRPSRHLALVLAAFIASLPLTELVGLRQPWGWLVPSAVLLIGAWLLRSWHGGGRWDRRFS